MIKTKFGNANISSNGYYQITSSKEGNMGKYLHRLIWEDNFKVIPNGFVVHHKDGNKTNNCILNLQLMKESTHNSYHNKGKNNIMFGKSHSEITKQKISKARKGILNSEKTRRNMSITKNTVGYRNVYKRKDKRCKQGFEWVYTYFDEENKRKSISSVNIKILEKKVKTQGLPWEKFL